MTITPQDLSLPVEFTSFRSEVRQAEIILDLAAGYSSNRSVCLTAPPGIGKSVIGVGLARLLDARFMYLTVTKNLQNQVNHSFASMGMVNITGHSNYPCARVSYDETGELADLECEGKKDSNGASRCFYQSKVDQCLESSIGVSTNYAHWINLARVEDPMRLGEFDLLILDEAHAVYKTLQDQVAIKLYQKMIDKYLGSMASEFSEFPRPDWSLSDIVSWAKLARQECIVAYKAAKERGIKRELVSITRLGKELARIIAEVDTNLSSSLSSPNWVITKLDSQVGIRLVPIELARYAETYLFRGIKKVLFTSATVTKDDILALGVKPNDLFYMETPSPFDYKRRPIIYAPTTPAIRVDHKLSQSGERLLIKQIDRIIGNRLDRKGIIHTRSYNRAKGILKYSEYKDFLLGHESFNTREVIEEFKRSDSPCVLVSPSIEEGVDFPLELCNYIIIAKIPFLDSRDPIIKARKELDKGFYNREVARSIVQMSGRGMRSKKDLCEVFIICAHWSWLKDKKKLFPGWFRIAFSDDKSRVSKPLELNVDLN